MALLELRNVIRRFGDFTAVDNVSLSIQAGEFFTLLGPSGCGKTTLLRMIAGFDVPDSGQILLDGQDIANTPPEKRPIHTVFQSYALFPHMTVADNVAFPLKMSKVAPAEIKKRMEKALEEVQLSRFTHRFPHELSGGQKQRVAFARGLINRPRLLLMDEPLGALDAKLREDMQRELINLQKEVGITFIFVTHSQDEALALSQRIAVMNLGNIEQIGTPSAIYGTPANRFIADFIGKINLMEARVTQISNTAMTLEINGLGTTVLPPKKEIQAGDQGVIAIRPEQVAVHALAKQAEIPHAHTGKVLDFLYVGDVTTYVIELDSGIQIEALLANSSPGRARFFEVDDPVIVSWPQEAAQFLVDRP
ncbi:MULTISPECIES: ABC transporter ATP-binding protein [Nitrosomonas]|uniref:Spermidine/putrescine import ATP-binding protein PotA n=2 Tax=Nitrosomonas eutropha TaxID=916 RepID=POTA_NITEC|nr:MULTISPECIES: ABC transporter ATP-binding protein [Nitrosomonas]Q0AGF4.1 RecName: Full=Spermidine/putrescine import ATP-binding protein PotA [Nitrosomonas eutropha C91]ABI59578.1 spermidine/putrescine ABC transporter ATPase subunit [Nitrosomonas eutropha C91]MXS79894.1 spermidine/putrescine ABC transporter ATP-binding protein [Nitrosomonas sp. GH22]PXV79795.1 spermidine/putrescine transport system ATP-binding protein [Nitrosomonas eutropha]SCX10178.1 spermidine/putrescine transport system A